MDGKEISSSSSRLQTSVGGSTAKRPRIRRQTSVAWQGFELLPPNDDGTQKARCKWCNRTYTASKGTSNLLHHFNDCSKRERQTCIRPLLDQHIYREKVASAILLHNHPLSLVEQEGIRDLHNFLNDEAPSISRNTVKADILNMHGREREILRHALENVQGRICLTFDLWSSLTSDGYMCLTAHYADEEWVLQKRVLNFRHIPPPHTGVILATRIMDLLRDWGIERKIFTLTMDNASYNDTLVDCLKRDLRLGDSLLGGGKFFHVRCGAHVLNLIVKAGLNCIENSILKIRECVKYVRGSESRKIKFAECIAQVSMHCKKKVQQDVIHRWDSTYLMLESALEHRQAFQQLQWVDSNFKCCPSEEEWSKVDHLAKFLRPFYDITTLFSGSNYPTANSFFHGVWKIQLLINEEMKSSDDDMRKMVVMMNDKFKDYWECYSLVFSFAIILDPRFKLQFVEFCFSKLYPTTYSKKVRVIREELELLFDEYLRISSNSLDLSLPSSVGVGDSNVDEMDEFLLYESQNYDMQRSTPQLNLYLDECRLPAKQNLDVLQYWKENKSRYSVLAILARDILSIPITSVASESTFSIGGRVIGKYGSSILPDTAEALVCTRDWLCGCGAYEDAELDEAMTTDFAPFIATLGSFP